MRSLPEPAENRREFFRAGVRYGLLALVGAVAALTRPRRSLPGQRCVNRGLCRACAAFTECGLPQALSAKAQGGA